MRGKRHAGKKRENEDWEGARRFHGAAAIVARGDIHVNEGGKVRKRADVY